jgi:hypothetical protein
VLLLTRFVRNSVVYRSVNYHMNVHDVPCGVNTLDFCSSEHSRLPAHAPQLPHSSALLCARAALIVTNLMHEVYEYYCCKVEDTQTRVVRSVVSLNSARRKVLARVYKAETLLLCSCTVQLINAYCPSHLLTSKMSHSSALCCS